jgi:hypothetical protein
MPGALARTSTYALNKATLPHVLALAGKGARSALLDDPHLRRGLNVWRRDLRAGCEGAGARLRELGKCSFGLSSTALRYR